ncbi:hypothetical protein ACMBCM_07960 [Spiroplasma sp. K1]
MVPSLKFISLFLNWFLIAQFSSLKNILLLLLLLLLSTYQEKWYFHNFV